MTRAIDLPREARAFLDALAVGESGGKDDDAAYSVVYGGRHFIPNVSPLGTFGIVQIGNGSPLLLTDWPKTFPEWSGVWINGLPTHAAGRYQFEPATWREQQQRLSLPDFSPESQDKAAWYLARRAYDIGDLYSALRRGPENVAIEVLQSTWTSLSAATFASRYTAALAAIGVGTGG